jgi:hypothetical protein
MSQAQPFTLQVSPKLSLVSVVFPTNTNSQLTTPRVATNHIIVVDCSGSMYGEINKIRKQLQDKLPKLVKPGDTVSIIWFSGRNEWGVIVEGLEVTTPQGLQNLQRALDRDLRARGLTGFKEPLEGTQALIERVTSRTGINNHSMLFLTDGYDNEWNTAQVVAAVKPLGITLASAVFVEYGYYANRNLLTKLAEEIGGRNIFSQDFPDFDPQFEAFVTSKQTGKPKREVRLPSAAKYEIAFTVDSEGITVYAVDANNTVLVDPQADRVFYHSVTPVGKEMSLNESSGLAVYASLNVLSQRMKSQDVWDILAYLGDVEFIDANANAFGKQKLYAFQNMCLETVLGQRKPYAKGFSDSHMPDENAYCVMDLLEDLGKEDENRFLSENPAFRYNRIGAKKVTAVSKEELALQVELGEAMNHYQQALAGPKGPATNKLIQEAAKVTTELGLKLASAATTELVFKPHANEQGTPITELVWNEARPNLSVRVKQTGTIDLSGVKADHTFPYSVETFRYRNYTLVKDGIVNVKELPVRLGEKTYVRLMSLAPQIVKMQRAELVAASMSTEEPGLIYERNPYYDPEAVYVLDLAAIPIINRSMVQEVSAKELFTLQYNLLMAQGQQSVYNHFQKLHFPKQSLGYTDTYGAEAAEWLKELGITDYNGFAPRVTDEKTGETYMATELNITIDGFKSKPTVKAVWDKLKAGKALTEREKIFESALKLYQELTESEFYADADEETRQTLLKAWLLRKQKAVVTQVREYLNLVARIKFAIILGQTWFKEFTDLEDNTLTMSLDGKSLVCQAVLSDVAIAI